MVFLIKKCKMGCAALNKHLSLGMGRPLRSENTVRLHLLISLFAPRKEKGMV